MTLAAALESVRLTEVWAALGGGPLRHHRGRAFWRNGDGWSVSVKDGKGWYDHRDSRGGGVLDLVQVALGCDKPAAVRWIAETFALDIDGARALTPLERQRYRQARLEAERFLSWREQRAEALRELRNFHLDSFHRALRLVLTHGLNHPRANYWATASEQHEARYQALDREIDELVDGPVEIVLEQFRHARAA